MADKEATADVAPPGIYNTLQELRRRKNEVKRIQDAIKILEDSIKDEMTRNEVPVYNFGEGRGAGSIRLVQAERVRLDEDELMSALPPEVKAKVTKEVLDTVKLEAAVALDDEVAQLVAVNSTVTKNKPYLRIGKGWA